MKSTIVIFFVLICYAQAKDQTKFLYKEFITGAASGAAGMVVYTPFHYFQNKTIQKLPIEWEHPTRWFRGLPSLALGKAPAIATQLGIYAWIERKIRKDDKPLSNIEQVSAATIAGAAAGCVNNFTHLVTLHQENKGTSFAKTVYSLAGYRTLFTRGLGVTISREMLFSNLFLILLKKIKQSVHSYGFNPIIEIIGSGLLVGSAVAATTQPFMVITAKLYADMEKKEYQNGISVLKKILHEKNILQNLYKGYGYRSIGVILALPVFDQVKEAINNYLEHK